VPVLVPMGPGQAAVQVLAQVQGPAQVVPG